MVDRGVILTAQTDRGPDRASTQTHKHIHVCMYKKTFLFVSLRYSVFVRVKPRHYQE